VHIILLQDYEGLGKTGAQLEVKDGFARNFLIPQGVALKADKNNIKRLVEINRLKELKKDKELKTAQKLADKLATLSLTVPVQVGEEDRVFGSVTSQEIAIHLKEKGYEIDKHQILIDEPIKALGIFDIPIKLHAEVTATIKLWVIKA
jgi:large subunit ribosomal protein L9